ncbi:MAG: flagellar basal body rod protein FlgB [Planctomycetaceae bacterium]|jgi:flagellar basal-body rod protein FlgB|nr:MAG: flagellar basal body rod protein FlgB [Planctomycetaceae bacterium]
MNVTPSQFDTLSRLMDLTSLRHEAISQNIANVNTPGYQRRDVSFEATLNQKLGGGEVRDEGKLAISTASQGGPPRADGSNVDIDHEMTQLSKNSLVHQTATQLLASRIATMRSAITGT